MARQSALTDESLVERAQRGNDDAIEALLSRYATKLRFIAKTFHISGVDIDDRETECQIAALKAIQTYRTDAGAKFETWMKALCVRRLISMYRTATCDSNQCREGTRSLDREITEDGLTLADFLEDTTDFAALVINRIDAEDRLGGAIESQIDYDAAPIEMWARQSLPPERFADVVHLLRNDPSQPRLFSLGPTRDTEQGREIVMALIEAYNEAVWQVLCLVAEGHTTDEIASKVALPQDVVLLMVKSARRAVARAA